jgi:hypothetical protein
MIAAVFSGGLVASLSVSAGQFSILELSSDAFKKDQATRPLLQCYSIVVINEKNRVFIQGSKRYAQTERAFNRTASIPINFCLQLR